MSDQVNPEDDKGDQHQTAPAFEHQQRDTVGHTGHTHLVNNMTDQDHINTPDYK